MPTSPSGKIGIRRPSHSHSGSGGDSVPSCAAPRTALKGKRRARLRSENHPLQLQGLLFDSQPEDDETQRLAKTLAVHYRLTSPEHVDLVWSYADLLLKRFRREAAFEIVGNWATGDDLAELDVDEDGLHRQVERCWEVQSSLAELYVDLCDSPVPGGLWRVEIDRLEGLDGFVRHIREDLDELDVFSCSTRSTIRTALENLSDAVATAQRSASSANSGDHILISRDDVGNLYYGGDDVFLALEMRVWLLGQLLREPGRLLRVLDAIRHRYPLDAVRAACLELALGALQPGKELEQTRRRLDPAATASGGHDGEDQPVGALSGGGLTGKANDTAHGTAN